MIATKAQKIRYVSKPSPPSKKTQQKPQQSHQKQKIPSVRVILPWYISLLFVLVWLFIIMIIFFSINAIINYSDFKKWWNDNDGKKYKQVFSIYLLILYQKFSLGNDIFALFTSKEAHIQTDGEAEFLMQMIATYAKLTPADDDTQYFLKPYNICENIVVGNLDNSPYINTDKFKDAQWDDTTGWPTNDIGWRGLLSEWGIPDQDDGTQVDTDKWTKSQDNFLWNSYHLPAQTGFILSFMFNTATDKAGQKWYPSAFLSAVGLNAITIQNVDYSGGWWGFLKYGFGSEKDLTYATIISYLYATEELSPPPRKCTAGKQGLIWGSSGLAGFGAWVGIAALGPEAAGFAFFAGLAAGTASLINGYQNC